MKILYLHGWNSVVGGVKPTYLKSHGHEVIEPELDHEDFQAALRTRFFTPEPMTWCRLRTLLNCWQTPACLNGP